MQREEEWKFYTAVMCRREMKTPSALNFVETIGQDAQKQLLCASQAEKVGCVEKENGDTYGWSHQASRLLLKHVNCVFIFHFQLLSEETINNVNNVKLKTSELYISQSVGVFFLKDTLGLLSKGSWRNTVCGEGARGPCHVKILQFTQHVTDRKLSTDSSLFI